MHNPAAQLLGLTLGATVAFVGLGMYAGHQMNTAWGPPISPKEDLKKGVTSLAIMVGAGAAGFWLGGKVS
jgi:hypothetical protein